MIIYTLNLLITFSLALVYDRSKEKIIKNICFLLILLFLCMISGLRYGVGTDFFTYYHFYDWFPENSFNIFLSTNYNDLVDFEKGFSLLVWAIGQINSNPQFITFIISSITIIPILLTLKKYTISMSLSIFLYITTMSYYSAFNGVRQWIACSILFFSVRYIIEKNFFKYFIVVLIATCIHGSAFIFIVIYYIVICKPWGKRITLLIILTVLLIYNFTFVLEFVSDYIGGEQAKYFIIKDNDRGINYLRILVAAVPPIISFIFFRRLKKIEFTEKVDIFINFSILNLIFKVLAVQKNIINRFSLYFGIYNVILIPFFVKFFVKKDQPIIITIIILLYLIHMLLLLPIESNLLPYHFFF